MEAGVLSQERVRYSLAWARLSRHMGASYPCPPSILSQWFKQTVEGFATDKESLSRTSHRSSW